MDFPIKRGDRSPSLAVQLLDENGNFDTSAATGYFILSDSKGTGTPLFRTACTIVNDTGAVQYDWAVGDTDREPGTYYGEFEILIGGIPRTFPGTGYISVRILPDLDGP